MGSSFNEKYFEGYSKHIVIDKRSGHPRVEYVYDGEYYIMDAPDKIWVGRKFQFAALALVASLGHILSMAVRCESNSTWYVILPQYLAILSLFGLWVSVVSRLSAKRRMTFWEYRMSSVSVWEFNLTAAFFAVLSIIIKAVFAALYAKLDYREMISCALEVCCIVSVFIGYRMEHSAGYRREQSEDMPSGLDITSELR